MSGKLNIVNSGDEDAEQEEWNRHFIALIEYTKEHQHCNLLKAEKFECNIEWWDCDTKQLFLFSGDLGTWLNTQRHQYHHGLLTNYRFELLQKLVDEGKLSWSAIPVIDSKSYMRNTIADPWPMHYIALLEYCKEYGDCNVPSKSIYECNLRMETEEGGNVHIHYKENLGGWLDRQRQDKSHKRNEISRGRRQLLQQLEDEGKLVLKYSISEYTWIRHFSALIEYSKIYGHCNIQQRNLLECTLPANFLNTYDALSKVSYVDDMSTLEDISVCRTTPMNLFYNERLGKWLDHQRSLKKRDALCPKRMRLLNNLVNEGKLDWNVISRESGRSQPIDTSLPKSKVNKVSQYPIKPE